MVLKEKIRQYPTEKQLKYFTIAHKKTTNMGKMMYILLKTHFHVPGRPAISNCDTPTEKVWEFLDSHLQVIMQKAGSR